MSHLAHKRIDFFRGGRKMAFVVALLAIAAVIGGYAWLTMDEGGRVAYWFMTAPVWVMIVMLLKHSFYPRPVFSITQTGITFQPATLFGKPEVKLSWKQIVSVRYRVLSLGRRGTQEILIFTSVTQENFEFSLFGISTAEWNKLNQLLRKHGLVICTK